MEQFEEVILHLGVHKTATTYIQNTLWTNIDLLNKNKIAYISLDKMRNGITRAINDKNTSVQDLKTIINTELKSQVTCNKLILSDENIIGGVGDIYFHKTLYPHTQERIQKIKSLFKGAKIRIIITLREYSEFYASIYCEFLRHSNKFITFEDFVSNFDYRGYSWKNLINKIHNVFDKKDVEVLLFEDFKEQENKTFNAFVGDISKSLDEFQKKDSRKSFRNETINILKVLNEKLDSKYTIKFIYPIDQKVTKLGKNKKFNPWSVSDMSYFEKKYIRDINHLQIR